MGVALTKSSFTFSAATHFILFYLPSRKTFCRCPNYVYFTYIWCISGHKNYNINFPGIIFIRLLNLCVVERFLVHWIDEFHSIVSIIVWITVNACPLRFTALFCWSFNKSINFLCYWFSNVILKILYTYNDSFSYKSLINGHFLMLTIHLNRGCRKQVIYLIQPQEVRHTLVFSLQYL